MGDLNFSKKASPSCAGQQLEANQEKSTEEL